MNVDWQLIVVGACVAWAINFVARCAFSLFQNPVTSPCGGKGCHDCPSNSTEKSSSLIQLQPMIRQERHS